MYYRILPSELNLFFQRVSSMLEAGVNLHDAILFLEKGEANPKLRQSLESLHRGLAHGKSLSRSMRELPGIFPRLSIELIAVGEETGMLVAAMRRIANISQRSLERTRMIWAALAYPICLSVVMLCVVALFVVFVAPGDSGLFATLGDDMPWPSKVLIGISTFLSNPIYLVPSLLCLLVGSLLFRRYVLMNPEAKLKLHQVFLILPVAGPLIAKSEIARTLDVLASSRNVGAPLLGSLRSCRSVAGNLEYRRQLKELGHQVSQGGAFGRGFAALPFTPRYVGALLEVSDETGNLDQVSRNLAAAVEDDLRQELDTAVKLLEPGLLLVSGLAAGFVTLATFLPVVRLITNL